MSKPLPFELGLAETELITLARRVGADSPDRSRKVGAVLLGAAGSILTTGYNTLPEGVEHVDRYLDRPMKYDWTEHAERNAIYAADVWQGFYPGPGAV